MMRDTGHVKHYSLVDMMFSCMLCDFMLYISNICDYRTMGYDQNQDYFVFEAGYTFSVILKQLKELFNTVRHKLRRKERVMIIVKIDAISPDQILLILPESNVNGTRRQFDPVGIIDKINPYKFALSYYISNFKNIESKWCINQKSESFDLSKLQYLWPKYFDKVNGQYQTLNAENLTFLKKVARSFCREFTLIC